jgi:hypothetical protein
MFEFALPVLGTGDLISIISGGVGIAVTLVIYWLQNRGATTAKIERTNRAIDELKRTIEQSIVDDEVLTKAGILDLMEAMDRKHKVDLRSVCDPISLLQDVGLQIRATHYISRTQRIHYLELVDRLTSEISFRAAVERRGQRAAIEERTAPSSPTESSDGQVSRETDAGVASELRAESEMRALVRPSAPVLGQKLPIAIWSVLVGLLSTLVASKALVFLSKPNGADADSSTFEMIVAMLSLGIVLFLTVLARLWALRRSSSIRKYSSRDEDSSPSGGENIDHNT